MFAALGVSAETETDELLGKSARLRVSQREDDYLHDLVNRIDRVMPLSTNT